LIEGTCQRARACLGAGLLRKRKAENDDDPQSE
jgi:hypothetical protein